MKMRATRDHSPKRPFPKKQTSVTEVSTVPSGMEEDTEKQKRIQRTFPREFVDRALQEFAVYDFGSHEVAKLELSSMMGPKAPDGYYMSITEALSLG